MSTSFVLIALSALLLGAAEPSPVARAAFERGEHALAQGKLESAARRYQEALKISPRYAAALNGLGSVYFRQGRREEAIAQFERATRLDPEFALAFFNLAFSARKKGDFATAASAYERYTVLAPEDPDGFFGLAESLRALGQEEKALAAYRTCVANEKLAPEQQRHARAAIAELEKNAPPEPSAEQAREVSPVAGEPLVANPSLAAQSLEEGDRLMAQKRVRDAAFAFRHALNAQPGSTEANFKLATALAQLGFLPQAMERWEAVLASSKDAAVQKAARGNIERAKQRLATPDAASPVPSLGPLSAADRARARKAYEEGVGRVGRRDFSGATRALSEAIALEPTLAVAFVARGSAHLGLRRFSEAATDYAFALQLDPELSAPLYGLAEAYRGLGRTREAKGFYERYASSSAKDVRPELQKDARTHAERLR